MKKRIVALLTAAMLLCGAMTCYAVSPQASHYFDGYMLVISPQGNCEMAVSFSVFGTGKMEQIGAYSIRIEEEFGQDKWYTELTAYGDSDPDTFYRYDDYDCTGSFSFLGTPGVRYRAVMVGYAKNADGEEYSREVTCTAKVCK